MKTASELIATSKLPRLLRVLILQLLENEINEAYNKGYNNAYKEIELLNKVEKELLVPDKRQPRTGEL